MNTKMEQYQYSNKKYNSTFEVSKQQAYNNNDTAKGDVDIPDYIKMSLMQKDKRLLEYTNKLNESSSTITKLKQLLNQKDKEYNELKSLYKEQSKQISIKDNTLTSTQNQLDSINDSIRSETEALRQKNTKLITQINELISTSSQYKLDLEQSVNQSNALQLSLSNKERDLNEKKITIKKYEDVINGLTKDNQQIDQLTLQLNEANDIIEKLSKQDQINKNTITHLDNENDSLNNYIKAYIDYYNKTKGDYDNQIATMESHIIDLTNQLKQKTSEESSEKQKRKGIAKELDQLNTHMVNQLGLILLNIDHPSIKNNDNSLAASASSKAYEWLNDSKYDLLKGNLIKIYDKLNDYNQRNGAQCKLLQKTIDELTIENKELLSKIESQRKTEAYDKCTIEEYKKQMTKFEAFNENYNHLKNKYDKLTNDYEELMIKNKKDNDDKAAFIKKLNKKLYQNKELEVKVESSSNSILKSIEELTSNYNQLKAKCELQDSEITNLKQTNDKLIQDYTEKELQLKDQITIITSKSNNDIQQIKETSSNQIKQLTKLLEESKSMLLNYQTDYESLLEEKSKIEYRLQSIQQSIQAEEEDKDKTAID